MKTNSSKRQSPFRKGSIFQRILPVSFINKTARESGFTLRNDGKITPSVFLCSFIKSVAKGVYSYSAWANEIAIQTGTPITKQAIEERMNIRTENMVKRLFYAIFKQEISSSRILAGKKFFNIYCEDSTHINLPENLCKYFPGNISRGKEKAVLKIHTLYNFSKNCFAGLNIHCFRENDQSLADRSPDMLKRGDLLLRDLGFFVLSHFQKMISKGIYFITRKLYTVTLFDQKTGNEIDLVKHLKKNSFIDQQVLVGKERIKMRLIAIPVSQERASERRRKARKDRDKRLNHSRKYYKLLGYTLLLTNVEEKLCSSDEILNLYGLRWKIESIFKTWKSDFLIQKAIPVKCTNIHRINCLIFLFLIYILVNQRLLRMFKAKEIAQISPVKLILFVKQNLKIIFENEFRKIKKLLMSMCKYEHRKDRKNMMEKLTSSCIYA